MSIYITGMAGVIGSALSRTHIRQGDSVKGCDFRVYPSSKAIDILDTYKLAEHMYGCERLYHCAAMLGVKHTEDNPERCWEINVKGTQSVIEAAVLAGVRHIIMLSSSEIYGNQDAKFEGLKESDAHLGTNIYARSKIQNEWNVLRESRIPKTTVVRMFNTYGPQQVRQFVLPRWMEAAKRDEPLHIFGNHAHTRSYLYSADAAHYIMDIANNTPNNEVVNIAHNEPVTLTALAEMVKAVTNSKSEIKILTSDYTDRSVSRDIPWRRANTERLYKFSSYRPYPLRTSLQMFDFAFNTTIPDWVFSTELHT